MSESPSHNDDGPAAVAGLPGELVDALEEFLALLEVEEASASTLDAYRRDLERYLAAAHAGGAKCVADLAEDHVTGLVAALQGAELSSATIARNLSSLRRFHDHLLQQGTCPGDPTTRISPPKVGRREPDPLTVVEAERLVSAVHGDDPRSLRDHAMLETLYAAGLRVSELTALDGADLMAAARLLRVHGRGARERIVPLTEAAVVALERYVEIGRPHLAGADTDDTLFLNAQGRSLSRMGVWKIIRAAASAAGLERPVSPQTLRHTFAAHLLDGGALLQDVQHLLGHADIASTQVYARTTHEDLQQLHRTYHPRA
ncbi:MAG: tyrosine recombinase [Gemmatimonadetes bacterium]|nr:tyrosine recombinase [Gemmatimonadota bacterium]MBT6145564.1 tyrosine recombinase [Gemmatimonadota bacterium]MBT7859133.1 tyrosine recombinase [Gemmatimonadota bacterium]